MERDEKSKNAQMFSLHQTLKRKLHISKIIIGEDFLRMGGGRKTRHMKLTSFAISKHRIQEHSVQASCCEAVLQNTFVLQNLTSAAIK